MLNGSPNSCCRAVTRQRVRITQNDQVSTLPGTLNRPGSTSPPRTLCFSSSVFKQPYVAMRQPYIIPEQTPDVNLPTGARTAITQSAHPRQKRARRPSSLQSTPPQADPHSSRPPHRTQPPTETPVRQPAAECLRPAPSGTTPQPAPTLPIPAPPQMSGLAPPGHPPTGLATSRSRSGAGPK